MSQSPADFSRDTQSSDPAVRPLPQEEAAIWAERGDRLQKARDFRGAIAAYEKGLACHPSDFRCLCHKGLALEQLSLYREALPFAQAALRIDAADRDALMLCGKIERHLGNPAAAHACFVAVARMGVVRNYPTQQRPAQFRALLLFAPEAGNTPYESLIRDGNFDSEVLLIVRGYRNDPDDRSPRVDVVVNLLSDVDFGVDIVASAIDLADSLERPVVNHPRLILATDRETISRRFAWIPGMVMPGTTRIAARDLLRRARDGDLPPLPVIVRHAATHGGDRMELLHDRKEMLAFAEKAGDSTLYMTDFVDYRSADRFFRKYRFVFVGDEILPYHLAIGDVWKVHHVSTRMGAVEWMRREEEAFLQDPQRVFGPQGMAALDLIRRQIGLDYFGIDCGLDSEGRVVVFEVNASMLIHLDNPGFEYKVPHVRRIVDAFQRLLARKAHEYRSRVQASAAGPA
jgi:tetratricopeptide (TPR) repeat protein